MMKCGVPFEVRTGNFDHFLNRLETVLNVLHSPKVEFVICGDINVNSLTVIEN
jgi:hypothetical protein